MENPKTKVKTSQRQKQNQKNRNLENFKINQNTTMPTIDF